MSIRHGWLVGSALLLCAHVAGAEQVLETIRVGGEPTFAVSSTDGTRVYIGNAATADLSVIDTATDSVVTTIPLPHNEGPIEAIHLAMTPDGALLYAVDENLTAPGTVNVVSIATNAIVATLAVDRRPTAIAVRPDGREVYVVNHDGGSISIITAVDYQLATLPIDAGSPLRVAFSPDSRRAYVTRFGAMTQGGLIVVDTGSRSAVCRIDDASTENLPIVSRDGSRLYVTYYDPSADGNVVLRVLSTDTFSISAELPGPAASAWMIMSAGDEKGYLFSSAAPSALIFDPAHDTFANSIELAGPAAMPTWDGSTRRIFVPHFQNNVVSAIDVASDTVAAVYQTGNQPWSVTVAAGKQYVTNRGDGTVSVIGEPPPPAATTTSLTSSINPSTFGQSTTLTATVDSRRATATGEVQFFDGPTLIGAASLRGGTAALKTAALNAGAWSMTAVYIPSGAFSASRSATLTQTVNKASGTATLAISVLTPTYSDIETFRTTFTPSVAGGPAPEKVSFKVGSQPIGEATPVLVKGSYEYTWNGQMLDPAGSSAHQMKPDFRVVTATFADPNFTVSNPPPKAITIGAEDARVSYTGPASVSLGGKSGLVVLTVVVKDISAVDSDPARDPYPGDITNAQVSLIDRSTNTILSTVRPTLNGNDSTLGTATFNWPVNLGAAKSKAYKLGFIVSYYYRRNSASDNTVVVVSK